MVSNVRIGDLCRELEIGSRQMLRFLDQHNVHGYKSTSWVDSSLAGELRAHFSNPARKSERYQLIEQGLIRPRRRRSQPAATPAIPQTPRQNTKKKKETVKRQIEPHILKHTPHARQAAQKAKPVTKIQPVQKRIRPELGIQAIFPPMAEPAPRLSIEKMCDECHRLVHPAVMDQHKRERHTHPKLPDMKAAQFSFMILPPGHDWDYRTVFEHYLHQSRARSFTRNVIDWTRIEKIQGQLKPKLKSFGINDWFGYAVYEFPYTQRVVVECPIEGNATYVLWDDWQNKVRLTKGELRIKHPGQFRRVIHKGEWIEEVRGALKDG